MSDQPDPTPQTPAPSPAPTPPPSGTSVEIKFHPVDYVVIGILLVAAVVVVMIPGLVVTPTQRTVLFFLLALLASILMGRQAQAFFRFRQGPYLGVITGIWVVMFGTTILLSYLSKPDFTFGVFSFEYKGKPIPLERPDALRAYQTNPTMTTPAHFVSGDRVVFMFPEQVFAVNVNIETPNGKFFKGRLNYRGNQPSSVELTETKSFTEIKQDN